MPMRKKLSLSMTGFKHSDETRSKLSMLLKGKKKTPEHIEKIRVINIGRKQSEQTKEKRSIKFNKPVFIENKEYSSIKEASKILLINRTKIFRRLNSDQFPNWRYS